MNFGSSTGSSQSAKPFSLTWSGSSRSARRPSLPDAEPGKFTVDMTDPVGSIGGSLASAGMFVGGLAGGVLGAVGQVGIPGGPNIGDIPEAAGDALGAVGNISLGGTLPTNQVLGGTLGGGGQANIGAVPGAFMDVLGLPGRAVERTVAGMRVGAAQRGERDVLAGALAYAASALVPGLAGLTGDTSARDQIMGTAESLPPDLAEALDAGTMTADQVADELVGRGAGFSPNAATNLVAGVAFDPLNLVGGVFGKAGTVAQQAGVNVTGGAARNTAEYLVGRTYNAATHGMTAGQQAVATKFVGPATSGVFHALGSRPFLRLTSKAEELAPEYGRAIADGVAYGNRQIVLATMADEIAEEAARGLLKADQYQSPQAVASLLDQRVLDMQRLSPADVERRAEEMTLRVAHTFENMTPEQIVDETARKLARMTGMTDEDAAKIVRGDMREAQTVHLGYYGYLGHKLEQAKAAARSLAPLRATVDDSGAILPGQEAASQAENVAQGVARGGTAESGGAVRASSAREAEERLSADFSTAVNSISSDIQRLSDEAPLYARWSPDIEADRLPGAASSGLMDREAREAGISATRVDATKPNFGLDRQYDLGAPETAAFKVPGSPAAGFKPRQMYLVRGRVVGEGFDGEPLLDPESIEVVLRVPFRESVRSAAASKRPSIDYERLTLVAPDTLTVDRAADLLALQGQDFAEATLRYKTLRKYHGEAYDDQKVRDYIAHLLDNDALPTTVKAQTRDKPNTLIPTVIGDVRKEAEEFGYELGMEPKTGWKVITDQDGNIVANDPFVPFSSDATPLTVRNGIGRFMDSLTRGVTQTRLILDARRRLVESLVRADVGVNAREAEAIHRTILFRARDAAVSPRGLAMGLAKPTLLPSGATTNVDKFDDVFIEVLGPSRFEAFIQKHDPATLVMQAFAGDLARVGVTQTVSGAAKALPRFGKSAAALAEGLYPLMRFRFNPLFQAQELTESPFWNLLRGVAKESVPDDLAKTYQDLAKMAGDEWLFESPGMMNLAGGQGLRRAFGTGPIGRAIAHVPDVRRTKEAARVSQIIAEHPEQFRDAVQTLNPRLWRVMEEAYGTTDARLVTEAFLRERTAQTGGDLRAALATFDEARPDPTDAFAVRDKVARDLGIPATEPAGTPDYLFRAVSEEDYQSIIRTGKMKSDGRMNLTNSEGTVASSTDPSWYLPGGLASDGAGQYPGRVLKIKLDPADGWAKDTDGYWKTPGEVPVDRIAASPKITRDVSVGREMTWDDYFAKYGPSDPTRQAEYKAAYADQTVVRDGVEYRVDPDMKVERWMLEADGPTPSDAAMETVWNAFRYSFEQASKQAFTTHYFRQSRSFIERSVNHPYLGLYPASYMWGKVLPEFARFLLLRPFGQKAPLTGLAAWQKVQEAFVAQSTDPEFKAWMKDNKDAIYLANMLLPGLPSNMPVNAPAYARHISEDAAAGRKVDSNTISREVVDTAGYAFGPVRGTSTILKGLFDAIDSGQGVLEDNLENAARMYDGMRDYAQ